MRKFHRDIIFTKVPLHGHYKYKDIFQIFPCAMDNMPTSKYQIHFPCVLEFWTEEKEIIEMPFDIENFEDSKEKNQKLFASKFIKQDTILALLRIICFLGILTLPVHGAFQDM